MLLRALLSDSRSRLAAKVSGWKHPVSREWVLLAAVHDALIDTTPGVRSPQLYHLPRPWSQRNETRLGGKSTRTAKEALAILRPRR